MRIVDSLRSRGGCRRSGQGRACQWGFECKRVINGGAEIRIVVDSRSNFFQRVQCSRGTIHQGDQSRLNKRSCGKLSGIVTCSCSRGFWGAGKRRAGFWRILRMRISCSKMRRHQLIYIHLQFQHLVIHIFAGSQHYGRVNFQRNVIGAAGNQYHAHCLRAAAPFCQLRFVALRAVSHCDQRARFIEQPNFTNPPTALSFRNHLLSNDLAAVLRIDVKHVQVSAPLFGNQLRLLCAGSWKHAAAIPHRHLGNFQRHTERGSACQFRRANIRQQGIKFCAHGFTLIVSITWTAPPS